MTVLGPAAAESVPPAGRTPPPPPPLSAAHRPRGTAAALEGSLDEFSLRDLLTFLRSTGQSGTLHVVGDRGGIVHLDDGHLRAGQPAEDTTMADRIASGGQLDDDLVEEQLVAMLASVLIPGPAPFRFVSGPPDSRFTEFDFEIDEILEKGRQRLEAWKVIADVIGSTSTTLRLATELPIDVGRVIIERADWQVLATVDGTRTVADIVTLLGRTAFDVCSTLYRLVVAGVVELS